LGRYAGIDVYLHVTFLAFLALVGYDQIASGSSAALAIDAVLFFCAVFGCVLLHEFGHALMARRFGIRTRDITLLPIGGVARLERIPDRPMQELCVALAGPAVNVVLVFLLGLWLAGTAGGLRSFSGIDLARGSLGVRLLLVNAALVIFNMIPAFPMDGGRFLRALLASRMEHARATRIAATLGRTIALLFGVWALVGITSGRGNPVLLLIALFVWIGAGQEARAAQFRSSLSMRG
jgi:Zn-dependent protease